MSETAELEALREQLATAHLHLRRAERVCALVGWTASRQESDRDKALTQVWMDWCHRRPQMSVREAWPDLTDEGIALLAAQRDATRAATLSRLTTPADRAPGTAEGGGGRG